MRKPKLITTFHLCPTWN